MSADHTPGPWTFSTEEQGRCVVRSQTTGYPYVAQVLSTNARLIAAAPKLLAALENLIETTPSDIDCEDNLEKYRSFVLRVACAAVADVRDDSNNGRAPGDPGPAPDGVTYSDWLAFNNID